MAFAPDAKENFADFETKLTGIIENLTVIQVGAQNSLYRTSSYSTSNASNQKIIVIIFVCISALIAVIIGLFINASIFWPLREIIKSARLMAAGDLTQDIRTFGCKYIENHRNIGASSKIGAEWASGYR